MAEIVLCEPSYIAKRILNVHNFILENINDVKQITPFIDAYCIIVHISCKTNKDS